MLRNVSLQQSATLEKARSETQLRLLRPEKCRNRAVPCRAQSSSRCETAHIPE